MNYRDLKNFTINEFLILFFPFAIIIGPVVINFILVLTSFILLKDFILKKITLEFINTKWFLVCILFIFYNILNAFFSTDQFNALRGSIGQLRFILFSIFLLYFIKNLKNLDLMIKIWLSLVLFIAIDVIFQNFASFNMLGIPISISSRPSSFFGEEVVSGAYLTYMSIPIFFYFIQNFNKISFKKKFIYFLIYLIVLFAIVLTSERVSLLAFIGSSFLIILLFFDYKKFFIFLIFFITFFTIIYNSNNIFKNRINDMGNIIMDVHDSSWGRLWESSYMLFKDNFIFGVGLKNYRVDCDYQVDPRPEHPAQFCSTHPHNFLLEILSETGIVGTLIFYIFFILLLIKLSQIYKNDFIEKNFLFHFYGNILILLIYVWPIKTSGSFFTTFNGSFFWFNLGLALCYFKIASKKNV
jgi:O-antigen ligase